MHKAFDKKRMYNLIIIQTTITNKNKQYQALKDILRACILDFEGSWEANLTFMESKCNTSYQFSSEMPPFQALYGRKCKSTIFF